MYKETVVEFLERDLRQLRSELELYANEDDMWKMSGEIANSGGNLALHIIGNINHFIGATLGRTAYERNRENEFEFKFVPRYQMLEWVDYTIEVVLTTMKPFADWDLEDNYPIEVFEQKQTTGYMLIHLVAHLNYHLGQINYHRRTLQKPNPGQTSGGFSNF